MKMLFKIRKSKGRFKFDDSWGDRDPVNMSVACTWGLIGRSIRTGSLSALQEKCPLPLWWDYLVDCK